jgi:hypothetical protein
MNKNLKTTSSGTDLKIIEGELKQAISQFALYVDSAGNQSSGAGGLAIQINKRVKLKFQSARDELSEPDIRLLAALQAKLKEVLLEGQQKGLTRAAIKANVYALIDKFAELK